MQGKFFASVILALLLSNAHGEEVTLNPKHPNSYVVVKGDTLWDIAGRFLSRPWQWPAIWKVNPQIENPNLIYPGDIISLSYENGSPILNLTRGGLQHLGGRDFKAFPGVREYEHDNAIPPIPLDAIQQFLSRPRVVSEREIEQAAYVVGSQDSHLASGVGGRIYIRALEQLGAAKYSVFRPGGPYRDPDTNAILGYEALHVGDVSIEKLGDPATGVLTWTNREVLDGDRVMPQEQQEYLEFIPHAPAAAIDGKIISVIDGVSQIGQFNVVVLNKGSADGLEPGHVLAIHQAGEIIDDQLGTAMAAKKRNEELLRAEEENPSAVGRFFDHVANNFRAAKLSVDAALGERTGGAPMKVQLPEERAGELMVFRTFEGVSYALVMDTQRPIHIFDKVRNP